MIARACMAVASHGLSLGEADRQHGEDRGLMRRAASRERDIVCRCALSGRHWTRDGVQALPVRLLLLCTRLWGQWTSTGTKAVVRLLCGAAQAARQFQSQYGTEKKDGGTN